MTAQQFLETGYEFTDAENKALIRRDNLLGRKSKSITKLKYSVVIEIKELITQGNILDVMMLLLGWIKPIEIDELMKAEHTDFVYFSKWLEDELKKLDTLERNLIVECDEDLKEAGVDRMQKYGAYNIIDGLADGNILNWNSIMSLPYDEVYTKLLKNKDENIIRENLTVIKNRKNKK